jgi:hypothetical protein
MNFCSGDAISTLRRILKKNLKSFQLWESHGAIWQHSVTRLSKIWANTYDEKFTPNKSEDELDFKLI